MATDLYQSFFCCFMIIHSSAFIGRLNQMHQRLIMEAVSKIFVFIGANKNRYSLLKVVMITEKCKRIQKICLFFRSRIFTSVQQNTAQTLKLSKHHFWKEGEVRDKKNIYTRRRFIVWRWTVLLEHSFLNQQDLLQTIKYLQHQHGGYQPLIPVIVAHSMFTLRRYQI